MLKKTDIYSPVLQWLPKGIELYYNCICSSKLHNRSFSSQRVATTVRRLVRKPRRRAPLFLTAVWELWRLCSFAKYSICALKNCSTMLKEQRHLQYLIFVNYQSWRVSISGSLKLTFFACFCSSFWFSFTSCSWSNKNCLSLKNYIQLLFATFAFLAPSLHWLFVVSSLVRLHYHPCLIVEPRAKESWTSEWLLVLSSLLFSNV